MTLFRDTSLLSCLVPSLSVLPSVIRETCFPLVSGGHPHVFFYHGTPVPAQKPGLLPALSLFFWPSGPQALYLAYFLFHIYLGMEKHRLSLYSPGGGGFFVWTRIELFWKPPRRHVL